RDPMGRTSIKIPYDDQECRTAILRAYVTDRCYSIVGTRFGARPPVLAQPPLREKASVGVHRIRPGVKSAPLTGWCPAQEPRARTSPPCRRLTSWISES